MQTAKAMLGRAVEAAKAATVKEMEDERRTHDLLYGPDSELNLNMGDQRLNQLAALTYNSSSCERMFALLEKALEPTENTWKSIHKALLLLHTIVLYGSELAVDKSIQLARYVNKLVDYNSATVKRRGFLTKVGGSDFGAPVRLQARVLNPILLTDDAIRRARKEAREAGGNSMVPLGQLIDEPKSSGGPALSFGQGIESSVGAGFDLGAVPGMYENRPERYFDSANDPRRRAVVTGDSQATRDAMAPSLLDLAFNTVASSELPEAQYLPALERQRELERQLADQQSQLQQLQQLQQQQQQLQQQQQQQQQQGQMQNLYQPQQQQQQPGGQMGMGMGMGMGGVGRGGAGMDLLGLSAPAPSPAMGMQGMPAMGMQGMSAMQGGMQPPAMMGMGSIGMGAAPQQMLGAAPMMGLGMTGPMGVGPMGGGPMGGPMGGGPMGGGPMGAGAQQQQQQPFFPMGMQGQGQVPMVGGGYPMPNPMQPTQPSMQPMQSMQAMQPMHAMQPMQPMQQQPMMMGMGSIGMMGQPQAQAQAQDYTSRVSFDMPTAPPPPPPGR